MLYTIFTFHFSGITDSDIEKEVEIRKFAADLRKLCVIYQSGKETSTGGKGKCVLYKDMCVPYGIQ